MKWKYMFLLTVLLILISGCVKSNEKQKDVSRKDKVESVEKKEKQSEEAKEQETIETDGSKETELKQAKENESVEENEGATSQGNISEQTPEAPQGGGSVPSTPPNTPSNQPGQVVPSTPSQPTAVSYSPQTVVQLATAKTKAYGKILLTENLDRLLAEGKITQEEYNAYYPYDGAGYYSIFVETDLNIAQTTSGRLLGSVDGIAQYIAETLALEPGPYFLIEYVGVYSVNGTDFYEFRCYRA